jgi:hypothetical protein
MEVSTRRKGGYVIEHVDSKSIPLASEPSKRDIVRQMYRLANEGQIEPIVIKTDGHPDLDEYPYAEAQVVAAIRLHWATVLVTRRY